MAAHAARVGEKLRERHLLARAMTVFAHTHPHNGDPWVSLQHTGRIEATADSRALVAEAVRMLRPLWRPGPRWFKAGVMVSDLAPAAAQPRMLFATRDPARSARTMAALDAVNARYGRDTLRLAATGLEQGWGTRHHRLSPRYTTRADERLVARAWSASPSRTARTRWSPAGMAPAAGVRVAVPSGPTGAAPRNRQTPPRPSTWKATGPLSASLTVAVSVGGAS